MIDRRSHWHCVAILLAALTGLFAGDPLKLDNSRLTAASPFAACIAPCFENFDNVTPLALPTGWSATLFGTAKGDLPWRIVNSVFDSDPNSAFAPTASHVTDSLLTSRNIGVSFQTPVLTFRRNNNLESDRDGMVLEISIDEQGFQDIIAAGGSFVEGGYTGTVSTNFKNPLAGRAAWTGNSGGFVTTTVNLPSAARLSTIRLRWRVGTDEAIASQGVFIDSINLTNFVEPPANDNFANAQPISGSSGVITGSNLGATKEPNEPNHAGVQGTASVWYSWEAPSDGNFTLTTVGSASNTLLAVYTGSSLPGKVIASNDEQPFSCFEPPGFSGLSFDAIGGTVYHIAVDRRVFTVSGDVRLRWGRSAIVSGNITDASMRSTFVNAIELYVEGGGCYRRADFDGHLFNKIPIGGNYTIQLQSGGSRFFSPYPGNPSISPLTGDVFGLNFYLISPAHNISGTVTMPGGNTSGLTVTCASTPGNLVSRLATDLGGGKFQCSGLPTDANYLVTPSKSGFTFTPPNRALALFTDVFLADFTGAEAPTRTISGRVADSGGAGLSNVSIALSGSQIASTNTDANGNYSFTGIVQGGNYTVTPSNTSLSFIPASQSFNNLTADQAANFAASFLLQLVLDDSGQVAALNSVLLTRDPFTVIDLLNQLNTGVDRNTRVSLFLANFQLGAGETASSVEVNLIGSNNQSFDIPAQAVVPLSDGFTQVTFRLPDALTAGTCVVTVKAHGLTSNMGVIKIKT